MGRTMRGPLSTSLRRVYRELTVTSVLGSFPRCTAAGELPPFVARNLPCGSAQEHANWIPSSTSGQWNTNKHCEQNTINTIANKIKNYDKTITNIKETINSEHGFS